jgi:hypothetical protein
MLLALRAALVIAAAVKVVEAVRSRRRDAGLLPLPLGQQYEQARRRPHPRLLVGIGWGMRHR